MSESLNPETIAGAVCKADEQCVKKLIDALTPIIQARLARVLLGRWPGAASSVRVRQDMEDMVHDVFVFLLANGGRRLLAWDPNKGSASTFFGLLAERWLLNMLTSRNRNPCNEMPSTDEQLQRHMDAHTEHDGVEKSRQLLLSLGRELTNSLSERELLLFDLMYIRCLDDEHVRRHTGLSRDALYQARKRLLNRVRKLARKLGPEFDHLLGARR